jgi:hypothetical protein
LRVLSVLPRPVRQLEVLVYLLLILSLAHLADAPVLLSWDFSADHGSDRTSHQLPSPRGPHTSLAKLLFDFRSPTGRTHFGEQTVRTAILAYF